MEEIIGEKILKGIFERYKGEPRFVIVAWEEFSELVKKAYPLLIGAAKRGIIITYGEVGGKIGLYVGSDLFRLKIGFIVGACSDHESIQGRPLVSAIVVNETTRYPGKGFWGLSRIPVHLRKKTGYWAIEPDDFMTPEMAVFWASEVKRVYEYWKDKVW